MFSTQIQTNAAKLMVLDNEQTHTVKATQVSLGKDMRYLTK